MILYADRWRLGGHAELTGGALCDGSIKEMMECKSVMLGKVVEGWRTSHKDEMNGRCAGK